MVALPSLIARTPPATRCVLTVTPPPLTLSTRIPQALVALPVAATAPVAVTSRVPLPESETWMPLPPVTLATLRVVLPSALATWIAAPPAAAEVTEPVAVTATRPSPASSIRIPCRVPATRSVDTEMFPPPAARMPIPVASAEGPLA